MCTQSGSLWGMGRDLEWGALGLSQERRVSSHTAERRGGPLPDEVGRFSRSVSVGKGSISGLQV